MKTISEARGNYVWAGAGLLAAAVCAWYVLRFYYIFPIHDYLQAVPYFAREKTGELQWTQAHFLYGGQWYLWSTNLQLLLARLTGWNLFYEALVTLSLLSATILLWVAAARRGLTVAQPKSSRNIALASGIFVVFSVDQATNLLWTHQMSHFIHNFGVVLVAFALGAPVFGMRQFLLCVLGAVLAVYSFSAGFALLPLVLLVILLRGNLSWRWLFAATWMFISLFFIVNFVIGFRVHGLESFVQGAHVEISPEFIGKFLIYLPYFLGAPICKYAGLLQAAVGAFGLALALLLMRNAWKKEAKIRVSGPWLTGAALVIFAIGGAGITYIGRYSLGLEQASNPRYFTISGLFWLGLLLLYLQVECQDAARKARHIAGICVLGVLLALKAYNCVHYAKKQVRFSNQYNAAAREIGEKGGAVDDATLLAVFGDASLGREHIRTMQRLHVNIFHEKTGD